MGRVLLKEIARSDIRHEVEKVNLIVHKTSPPFSLLEELKKSFEVELFSHDLTKPWEFEIKTDVVFNMAADGSQSSYSSHSTARYLQINQNLISWSRRTHLNRIIHVSSGICDYLESASHSHILKSANKYEFAKGRLLVEEKMGEFSEEEDVSTRILRLYSFVGSELMSSHQYAISQFLQNAKQSRLIDVIGNSQTKRSYLNEVDLGKVLRRAISSSEFPRTSSIASREVVTMGELAELIGKMYGANVRLRGEDKPIEDYVPDYAKELLPEVDKQTKSLSDSIRSIMADFGEEQREFK